VQELLGLPLSTITYSDDPHLSTRYAVLHNK
jgi:hypothetical protein